MKNENIDTRYVEAMPKIDPATALNAASKLIPILLPLAPQDRQRAISAAMILLGQSEPAQAFSTFISKDNNLAKQENGLSGKGVAWMSRYNITREQLEHIFSIEESEIDIITPRMPGNSKSKQTVQAYILCGLKTHLQTGEMGFLDKDARTICQRVGCYDSPNHYNYTKSFKNYITGNKDSGWKITLPGLQEAAVIVKGLVGDSNA